MWMICPKCLLAGNYSPKEDKTCPVDGSKLKKCPLFPPISRTTKSSRAS